MGSPVDNNKINWYQPIGPIYVLAQADTDKTDAGKTDNKENSVTGSDSTRAINPPIAPASIQKVQHINIENVNNDIELLNYMMLAEQLLMVRIMCVLSDRGQLLNNRNNEDLVSDAQIDTVGMKYDRVAAKLREIKKDKNLTKGIFSSTSNQYYSVYDRMNMESTSDIIGQLNGLKAKLEGSKEFLQKRKELVDNREADYKNAEFRLKEFKDANAQNPDPLIQKQLKELEKKLKEATLRFPNEMQFPADIEDPNFDATYAKVLVQLYTDPSASQEIKGTILKMMVSLAILSFRYMENITNAAPLGIGWVEDKALTTAALDSIKYNRVSRNILLQKGKREAKALSEGKPVDKSLITKRYFADANNDYFGKTLGVIDRAIEGVNLQKDVVEPLKNELNFDGIPTDTLQVMMKTNPISKKSGNKLPSMFDLLKIDDIPKDLKELFTYAYNQGAEFENLSGRTMVILLNWLQKVKAQYEVQGGLASSAGAGSKSFKELFGVMAFPMGYSDVLSRQEAPDAGAARARLNSLDFKDAQRYPKLGDRKKLAGEDAAKSMYLTKFHGACGIMLKNKAKNSVYATVLDKAEKLYNGRLGDIRSNEDAYKAKNNAEGVYYMKFEYCLQNEIKGRTASFASLCVAQAFGEANIGDEWRNNLNANSGWLEEGRLNCVPAQIVMGMDDLVRQTAASVAMKK